MLKFGRVNSFFFVLVLLVFTFQFSTYFYIIIFFGWLAATAIGSFFIKYNYHLNALISNPDIAKKQIAITFDDGPNPQFTPPILALLKRYDAKASFFCIGKHIEKYPELFKQIADQGHVVGNHSYSHSNNFGFFSSSRVINEISKTNNLIFKLLNIKNNLFRPPFGVTNPAIKNAIKKIDHHVIGWNVRSLDTKIKDPKEIFNRISKNLKAGDVILLHDSSKRTVVVLEQLLLFLQEHQFETITVDKLFEIEAYA